MVKVSRLVHLFSLTLMLFWQVGFLNGMESNGQTMAKSSNQFLLQLIRRRAGRDTDSEARRFPDKGNANVYFDDILKNMKQMIVDNGYDPISLGPVDICTDCILAGLRNINRTGDASYNFEINGDVIVQVNVGFNQLKANCDCVKRILLIPFRGHVVANLRNLALQATLKLTLGGEKPTAIEKFELTNRGTLDLDWSGRGFMGFLSNAIFGMMKSSITREVQKDIPSLMHSAIAKHLDKLPSLIDMPTLM